MNALSKKTANYLANHFAHEALVIIASISHNRESLVGMLVEFKSISDAVDELGITADYVQAMKFCCMTYGLDESDVVSVIANGIFSVTGW